MKQTRKTGTLIIGGGPGGRTAYAALHRSGKKDSLLVMNIEPIAVCSLLYGVGRRLIPTGPEDTVSGKGILPLIGTLAMGQVLIVALNIAGKPTEHPPATSWGVSALFGLHWGSVGLTEELAKSLRMKAESIVLPVRTREPVMPDSKQGHWKVIFSTESNDSVEKGQILGFQIVLDGDSQLSITERFIDIITRHETVPELINHFYIHSPSHNPPDDPYMGIMFRYGINNFN